VYIGTVVMKSRLRRHLSFPSLPNFGRPGHEPSLDVIRDSDGLVQFGWVASGVLYARFAGALTANSGQSFAVRLSEAMVQMPELCFFVDASELTSYDVLARSALARVILSRRRRFTSIMWRTDSEGPSPSISALTSSLGEPIEVTSDEGVFELALLRKAPLALRIVRNTRNLASEQADDGRVSGISALHVGKDV